MRVDGWRNSASAASSPASTSAVNSATGARRASACVARPGRSRVRVGDPALPTADFDARSYFARFSYDRLDDVNFPREGQSLAIGVARRAHRPRLRSFRRPGHRRLADRPLDRAATPPCSGLPPAPISMPIATDVRSRFSLGGFLNLSGISRRDSISGNDFAIARPPLLPQDRQRRRGVPERAGLSRPLVRGRQCLGVAQ